MTPKTSQFQINDFELLDLENNTMEPLQLVRDSANASFNRSPINDTPEEKKYNSSSQRKENENSKNELSESDKNSENTPPDQDPEIIAH